MRNREYSHPALTEFANVAESFCCLIAHTEAHPPAIRLDGIHRLLPQGYAAALQLPSTSVLFDDEVESSEQDSDTSRSSDRSSEAVQSPDGLENLADYLGIRRFYREVFDPYAAPTDAEVVGDIVDDLGDIYRDLFAGLTQWRQGNPGEALWEWRFGFEHHWAEHATSALRALFALSAWHDVPWPADAG